MKTITTVQGDTWDIIAKREYGNELLMDVLIKANIQHRKTVIFSAGVVLNVPELDETELTKVSNLPIWKQGGA